MKTPALLAATALALLAPLAAVADDKHHQPATAAAAAAAELTAAEVRKVDLEAGKVTLRHAHIKNLDMPPMTMVFVVKDKALLDRLQPGDKVRFKAIDDAGKLTVTAIERAN